MVLGKMQSLVALKDTLKTIQNKGNKSLLEKVQSFWISLNCVSQHKINFFNGHIIAAASATF